MQTNPHSFKNFYRSLNTAADVVQFVDDVYDSITRWNYSFDGNWHYKQYGVSEVEKEQLDELNKQAANLVGMQTCYAFLMARQNEDND